MPEDPWNIKIVFGGNDAPKPDHSLVHGRPLESLIGHLVKKGFPCKTQGGSSTIEHMWVLVRGVKDGALIGELDNEPSLVHAKPLKNGDTVTVQVEEVEMVLPPSNG